MNKIKLRNQLIQYLSIYITKKDLKMKPLMIYIQNVLVKQQNINHKQLASIIKFVEREPRFMSFSRKEVISYFSPIVNQEIDSPSTPSLDYFY